MAASIAPGSDLLLTHVGINPTRIGVINILRLMGADITLRKQREVGGEPVADIRVRYAPLKGIEIPEDQVPLAIDEFPALFIAAACAQGRTVLRGAEELRVKESDRIAAMAEGLTTLGIVNEVLDDGIIIEGGTWAAALSTPFMIIVSPWLLPLPRCAPRRRFVCWIAIMWPPHSPASMRWPAGWDCKSRP